MIQKLLTCLCALTLGLMALAQNKDTIELEITFTESAPKDIFTIRNISSCDLSQAELIIDLSESAGQLIFDTTATGAGVEVFQPFEVVEGEIGLAATDFVQDGEQQLALTLSNLDAGSQSRFTIDLDDQLPEGDLGMIRVTGGEMQGATARLISNEENTAVFTTTNRVLLSLNSCG